MALQSCAFFEIEEADARQMTRENAQNIADKWRDALREVGVSGSLARDHEEAFINDQTSITLGF